MLMVSLGWGLAGGGGGGGGGGGTGFALCQMMKGAPMLMVAASTSHPCKMLLLPILMGMYRDVKIECAGK